MKYAHLLALCSLLVFTLAPLQAEEPQFKLELNNTDLVVQTAQGAVVATLPTASIGKSVDVPPVSFQVSYGRDANGNLSVVLSPNPQRLVNLNFSVLNRKVEMDKESIVTLTFPKDGKGVTVDPGFVGAVKVDGQILSKPSLVNGMVPPEPTIGLAADANAQKQESEVVPVSSSKQVTKKELAALAASNKLVKKDIYWAEPVTPPNASKAMAVAPNEMKLAEVKGDVKVISADGKTSAAQNGAVVDSQSKLVAGPKSSAAVLIGGVNSVRITSETKATVSSSVESGKRTTLLDLEYGTLFSKVGKREGEEQDFKVKSPQGVAAARGTDFATVLKAGRMIIMCVQGAVQAFNSTGQLTGNAAPTGRGNLAYTSTSPVSLGQQMRDMLQTMAVASESNEKVNALLERQANGGTLTPAEQNYLGNVAIVELAVKPTEANLAFINALQMLSPDQIDALLNSPDGGNGVGFGGGGSGNSPGSGGSGSNSNNSGGGSGLSGEQNSTNGDSGNQSPFISQMVVGNPTDGTEPSVKPETNFNSGSIKIATKPSLTTPF